MAHYKDVDTTFFYQHLFDKDLVTIHRLTESGSESIDLRIESILGCADAIREARMWFKMRNKNKRQTNLDFSLQRREK